MIKSETKMVDMNELALAIRADSEAILKIRNSLPESKRPENISDLKKLLARIMIYVKKNDYYQSQINELQHKKNTYGREQGREGDQLVRPAWLAKTGLKEPPWPFDQNFIELIKIFHHCYAPMLKQLETGLERIARTIEQGMALLPSKRQMKLIRSEVSRLASELHWLQENWRVHYLQQIDSSGKKHFGFQEVPLGIPHLMSDVEKKLLSVTNRLKDLGDSFRGEKSLGISMSQLVWGIIAVLLTVFGLILANITGLTDLIHW